MQEKRIKTEIMTFREVGGMWRRVDSQEPKPPTLAEILERLGIIIDDHTQFARLYFYYKNFTQQIIYRHYGGQITIQVSEYT